MVAAVPSAARDHLKPPLAYDVERVLRTALMGPAEPVVDLGLGILDTGGAEPDGRSAQPATARHSHPGRDGRGPAGARRGAQWAARRRTVLAADTAAGAAVATVGSALQGGSEAVLPALLLPPALVVSLALSGAYERHALRAGLAEYARVAGAGVCLMLAGVLVALLSPVALPRSYVLGLLPAVAVGALCGRILVRRARTSWLS